MAASSSPSAKAGSRSKPSFTKIRLSCEISRTSASSNFGRVNGRTIFRNGLMVDMQSIDLIRDNLRKSRDRVLARVEEMREHCVVSPTRNGGCHTLWVLGHLAYIEALVVRRFMLGEDNPLAEWAEVFDGADTSGDVNHYP